MRYQPWVLWLCVSAGPVGTIGCAEPASTVDDRYAVYSAVITQVVKAEEFGGDPQFYSEQRPIGLIVLLDSMVAPPAISSNMMEAFPRLEAATIQDLQSRPALERIGRSFGEIGEYQILSTEELTAIFDEGGWKEFYRRYSTAAGLVQFSPVGFNATRNQALVYMMHVREGLWGHADFYILEREERGWLVVDAARALDI